jgi:tRNA(Ile2) C34 agmatinyltransferase TiaS
MSAIEKARQTSNAIKYVAKSVLEGIRHQANVVRNNLVTDFKLAKAHVEDIYRETKYFIKSKMHGESFSGTMEHIYDQVSAEAKKAKVVAEGAWKAFNEEARHAQALDFNPLVESDRPHYDD